MVELSISCKHVQSENDITSQILKLDENANFSIFIICFTVQKMANFQFIRHAYKVEAYLKYHKNTDKADFRKYRIISQQIL